MKNPIIIINIVSIILAIILIVIIIIVGLTNNTSYSNTSYSNTGYSNAGYSSRYNYSNKNNFYGDPPGRQRAVGLSDLGDDRGWASFRCYTQQGFDIDCDKLNGHQGLSPDAMSKYQEFGEKYD